MIKKVKMTRSENLNPPEDPGIKEEIISPILKGEVGDEKEKDIAVAVPTDVSAKGVQEMVDDTEKKIEIISEFIKKNLKEGVDYGSICFHYKGKKENGWKDSCPNRWSSSGKIEKNCHIACKMSKPFLQKPGSEKFAILFNHRAKFIWIKQDFEKGIFACKCVFINRKNEDIIGEGYGSARVSEKSNWTENEAMKIASKRAQIDCALRSYGLSEHFTQDLDDVAGRNANGSPKTTPTSQVYTPVPSRPISPPKTTPQTSFTPRNPNLPMSDAQNRMIFKLISIIGKDKIWLEKWIFSITGVEQIEKISMGWASKIIEALKKKADTVQQEGLETIEYDREPDNISEPKDVEISDEDLDAFNIDEKVEEKETEEI